VALPGRPCSPSARLVPEANTAGWDHCEISDNRLVTSGLLENRVDRNVSERGAWDQIRDEGWELVAGAADPESGQLVHYFKRPRQEK